MRTRAVAVMVASCLLVQGCGAGWRRPAEPVPGPLAPRQQVEVWQGNRATRWHAVVVTADSVSGVPYFRPIDCDRCRVGVARSTVDSLRLGNPVAAFWNTIALVMAAGLAFLAIYCSQGCNPQ